jgi:hypothetical protein
MLKDIKLRLVNNRLEQLCRGAEQKLEEILSCYERMNPGFYDFLGKLDDNFFDLRRKDRPINPNTYKNIFTQIQNIMTTETLGRILHGIYSSTYWGLLLKYHVIKLLLAAVEQNFKGYFLERMKDIRRRNGHTRVWKGRLCIVPSLHLADIIK